MINATSFNARVIRIKMIVWQRSASSSKATVSLFRVARTYLQNNVPLTTVVVKIT
jgi:hypothetical protein